MVDNKNQTSEFCSNLIISQNVPCRRRPLLYFSETAVVFTMEGTRRSTRIRSSSFSGSDVSDSETPSMLSGKPPASKRAKASAAKLETVVDSPEPQPAKKLMFTPAAIDANGGKSKKSGVQFDNTVASTPAASSKATARATSTRRSKRGSDIEIDDDDGEDNTAETPVANGNGKLSAKKSAKKEKAATDTTDEQLEEPAAGAKSAKKESAKKSAKKEKASTVVDSEHEVEPAASAESSKAEAKSAKKSTKKEAKLGAATPKNKQAEEAAAAALPSKAHEEAPTATIAAKSAKKSTKKADEIASAAVETAAESETGVEMTKAEKKQARKRAAKARKLLAEARAANPAGALAQADPSKWHLKVHRCRFAGWMPDPIHCLAATPAAWGANRVAVARSGGDLELVHVDERWAVEARVAGPPVPRQPSDHSAAMEGALSGSGGGAALSAEGTANSGDVRALCWVNGSLVGGTLGGLLFAADFAQGVRTRQTDALGGAVWALATPPPAEEPATDGSGSSRSMNGATAFEKDAHELVAAGCEDGTVRIFRVVQGGDFLGGDGGGQRSFEYVKTLGSVGARVTSLAWAPPFESADGGAGGSLHLGPLFAGTTDGTIHRFDVAAGRGTARMTLERRGTATGSGAASTTSGNHPYGDDGDAQWSVVWALLALRDGTVVSGDSSGCVQFWDGLQCAHVSRQETHAADVLCLAASADQLSLFASGIDHKVVCLRRLGSSGGSGGGGGAAFSDEGTLGGSSSNRGSGKGASNGVWSLVHAYRAHQLDVRALATVQLSKTTTPEHNSVPAAAIAASVARTGRVTREILVSGGLDTKLCTYHVRHFTEHRPKRIWPFPYHSVVALAAAPRLVLAQHRDKLCLWKLPSSTAAATAATQSDSTPEMDSAKAVAAAAVGAGNGAAGSGNETHRLLLEVTLKAASALVCSAVAPDGHWLAVSDTARLRVFRIHGSSGSAAAAAKAAAANDSNGKASLAEAWLSSGDVRLEQLKLPASCAAPCQKLCFTSLGSGGGGGGGARLVCGTQSGLLQVLALTATSPPVAAAPKAGGAKTITAHAELEHCFRFNEDTTQPGSSGGGAGDSDSDDDNDNAAAAAGNSNGKNASVSEQAWKVFGASGKSSLPFSALAVSPDGQWLAAAGCRNALAVYSLDRNGLFWLPPRPPARISSLAFHPSCGGSGLLAAACVDNRFHLFEVEARRLADW